MFSIIMLSVQLEEQMKIKLDQIIMNRTPVFLWKLGASILSIIIVIKFILSICLAKNFQVFINRIQWNRYIKVYFKDHSVIKHCSGSAISVNNTYVARVRFFKYLFEFKGIMQRLFLDVCRKNLFCNKRLTTWSCFALRSNVSCFLKISHLDQTQRNRV